MRSRKTKNYFKDIVLPDEDIVRILARLWFTGEQLNYMIDRGSPLKVINDATTTYLVNRGWLEPIGEPYVQGTGTFQAMEVSFTGLVVVEYYLRRKRLTNPKHRGKAGRPSWNARMQAHRPQPSGELHDSQDQHINRSGQRAGVQ